MDTPPYIDVDDLSRGPEFTGLWEVHWPNGRLKCRGHFVQGIAVGQHLRLWEDGTLAYICWYDPDGNERGTSLSFDPDGDKSSEETRDDEQRRPATFTRRDYDANGDVWMRTTYVEYEIVDDWRRPGDERDEEGDRRIDRIVKDAIAQLERRLGSNDDESDDKSDDEMDRSDDHDRT